MMAEAITFQPFALLKPTIKGSRHHVSLFCVNCKSLIVKEEDIVEIKTTPYGPEVWTSACEGKQLQPFGWEFGHQSHTRTMRCRGFLNAEIVKQKVVCKCHYESKPVKAYYNLKMYSAGFVIRNKTREEQPFFDGDTGCVIRYGLNGGQQLVWTGHQRNHALVDYEDGKLMGKWSKEGVTVPCDAGQEFRISQITEFQLLSSLSATKRGSPHCISLHCSFCRSILVRPDHIAHISVKERGDRIIWTRASPVDSAGAVIENLVFFGEISIHEINTQRMRQYGYWKTTIMYEHVMCKCRYVPDQPFNVLRQFKLGFRFFDKDPKGVGFLDLDCDYRLIFRFFEQQPAMRCIVWAGDQSKHLLRNATLPNISLEIEEAFVVRLKKVGGILTFSPDQDEAQEEFKSLIRKMASRKTCSRPGVDNDTRARETAALLEEVQKERAVEEIGRRCHSVMSTRTGIYKHYQVILVGEPAAGKTSFRRAAMGEEFDERLDGTEGISVTATSAKLTDKRQHDSIIFQPSLPDGVLVDAFAGHLQDISRQQPDQAKKSTGPLGRMSKGQVTARPEAVIVSSKAELLSNTEPAAPPENSERPVTKDTGYGARHLKLSEASVKRIQQAKAHPEENSSKTFVRFVDCGGHLSFLSTQTVCFGTKNTLYCLAFDVSLPLLGVGEEPFRKCGSSFPQGKHLRLSHIDYVMHWLNNIAMISISAMGGGGQRDDKKTVVFLLATHIDKVLEPEKVMAEVKSAIIDRLIKSNLENELDIRGPYFIDNRHPESAEACAASEMSKVQEDLHNEIEKSITVVEVPLEWLVLDVVLDEMQNKFPVLTVKDFLSLKEVSDVVQNCQESVDKLLTHFHDVGRVHFLCAGEERLSEEKLLFLNPEWLVKEITKVMVCSMEKLHQQTLGPRKDIAQLQEKGILTESLYSHLWRGHPRNVQQELLRVMELYGLQAPIYGFTQPDQEDNTPIGHWVPSCLKLESDKFSSDEECAFKVPPMLLMVNGFFMPFYVFARLTAYLLQEYKPSCPTLALNAIQFTCCPQQKSTFYDAHVSFVDHGIRLVFLCCDREVALGKLSALPDIGQAAQQFCTNVCKMVHRIFGNGSTHLKLIPLFACPSPAGKQTWVQPTLPVQLPVVETVSKENLDIMRRCPHRCPPCSKSHKLPENWLAWFGWLDNREPLQNKLPADVQPGTHDRQLPMASNSETQMMQSMLTGGSLNQQWQHLFLHEKPKLINKLCEQRWNFGQHWREILRNLVNTNNREELAFSSPSGIISEIEQQKISRSLTLSECFREVLEKWMEVCSPTAWDLYDVLDAQGLGEKAKRCFQEYSKC